MYRVVTMCTRIGDGGVSCGILPGFSQRASTARQVLLKKGLRRTPDYIRLYSIIFDYIPPAKINLVRGWCKN